MENLKDRITIYEVAKASGVSLATVSRVINHHGNVTDVTRRKVEETITRLGYKPSGLAQALATSKSTTIGVIIPSANYVYIANMLNGISEEARKKGFSTSLFTTSHNKKEALEIMEKVITSHVDGAIIFDDELDINEIININSYNVPTIAVNNKIVGESVGCITFGVERLLREIITKQLKSKNAKKMIFVHLNEPGRLLDRMENCFIQVHEKLHKDYDIYECDDSYSKTYEDFLEYFKTNKTGYFIAYRDSLAAAIINAAIDSNLKVPEDVEVFSAIGTKYSNIIRPTISNLSIDMHDVGVKAMEMLSLLLKGELKEKKIKAESTYNKKDSTKE